MFIRSETKQTRDPNSLKTKNALRIKPKNATGARSVISSA